jgi:hypothetical protein
VKPPTIKLTLVPPIVKTSILEFKIVSKVVKENADKNAVGF